MQHHGAPTRLLDFSYSLYTAAYFAIETTNVDAAVWAVNFQWALDTARQRFLDAGKDQIQLDVFCQPLFDEQREAHSEHLFVNDPLVRLVMPVNPFRLNERLRTQKGIFLMPGDVTATFQDNLAEMPGHADEANLIKIVVPPGMRREALKHLFDMNISRTSLFPGLDGFANSLGVYAPLYDP